VVQDTIKMDEKKTLTVAVIVSHPDDETLWAGGTILSHPSWKCFVVCLCRGSDTDRAPKFYNALKVLNTEGLMGDLDDGPEQKSLDEAQIERVILDLLPLKHFDLVITHDPGGEYTRHIRHEETGKAVIKLWLAGKIAANELWTFAYEDGSKEYYPRPVHKAPVYELLMEPVRLRKYDIITRTYGFEKNSWEARTTPGAEAFWRFTDQADAKKWLEKFPV
jgi:LmbE family N-acetylglucosaminyl deacetylase